MSTVTCPNGHVSADPEWCDTCGAKIGSAGPSPEPSVAQAAHPDAASVVGSAADPAADPAAGGAATQACPHCGTVNPVGNLFCEQCGYDFTTGQTPPEPPAAAPGADSTAEVPLDGNRWIVIVEIDPAWYGLKGALADQPCPPPSSSTVALTQHTSLIGRSSQSLGVRPEIGLDNDTGVSRRHAQFVRQGDTVSVIDLSSTNGTYVVRSDGGDPDDDTPALDPGVATELADGDRVYVGAWSRLTLRTG